nr:MAG TPA: hypothetical protein [Caudoviricetes sp.]
MFSYSKYELLIVHQRLQGCIASSPQVLDQVIFIIIMRVKRCANCLRTCKINEIHLKLSKEYICLLFR